MKVNVLFAGIPVTDFDVSRNWYELLLGRPADIPVHDHEVMWRIGEGAWMYVVADPERAGRSLVSMAVSDLDQTIAEVEGRGITVERIERIGDAERKATVLDPDGNTVAIIEVLQQDH
jgi:catechol 2,3-dioxygenase-like lactoylglutathione lyase family enzyme